jgi:hypothetical protein
MHENSRKMTLIAESFWVMVPLGCHLGLSWYHPTNHSVTSTLVACTAASIVEAAIVARTLCRQSKLLRQLFAIPWSGFVHYTFLWCTLTGGANLLASGSTNSRIVGAGFFWLLGLILEVAWLLSTRVWNSRLKLRNESSRE